MTTITCKNIPAVKFGDCFFCPDVWDDESKRQYTEWLARQDDTHPSKSEPEPWRSR